MVQLLCTAEESHMTSIDLFFQTKKLVNEQTLYVHLMSGEKVKDVSQSKDKTVTWMQVPETDKTSNKARKRTLSPLPVPTGVPEPHSQTRSSLPCLP